MTSIPLLSLPPAALERTLDLFEMHELFQLTQCSQKTSNIVEQRSLTLTPLHSLSIDIEYDSRVQLRRELLALGTDTTWKFHGHRSNQRSRVGEMKSYRVKGQDISFDNRDEKQFECLSNQPEDVIQFAKNIKDLFNARVFMLSITVDSGVLESFRSTGVHRDAMFIDIRRGRVSHEEMRLLFEVFDGATQLTLYCNPGPEFTYNKTVSMDELNVYNGKWMTGQVLMHLNCRQISIHGHKFSNEDLNAFLRNWMESSDTKLEDLAFHSYQEYVYDEEEEEDDDEGEPLDLEKIANGLPTFPGQPKRCGFNVPYENGLDFRRKTDGMLGTVLLCDRREDYFRFLFNAWHVFDPNRVN